MTRSGPIVHDLRDRLILARGPLAHGPPVSAARSGGRRSARRRMRRSNRGFGACVSRGGNRARAARPPGGPAVRTAHAGQPRRGGSGPGALSRPEHARAGPRRAPRLSMRPPPRNAPTSTGAAAGSPSSARGQAGWTPCGGPARSRSGRRRVRPAMYRASGSSRKPNARWWTISPAICGDCPAMTTGSRAICHRMMDDERRHGTRAVQAGGRRLPTPVRFMMRAAAGVMTATAYRI